MKRRYLAKSKSQTAEHFLLGLEGRETLGSKSLSSRSPNTGTYSSHSMDLEDVQRFEQQELLAMAVEIRLQSTAAGRLLSAPYRPAVDERIWRSRCRTELVSRPANRVEVDDWLASCLLSPKNCWPDASRLAEHLCRQMPTLAHQLLLVRALVSNSESHAAQRTARNINQRWLPRAQRASLVECLGIDAEATGEYVVGFNSFLRAESLGGRFRCLLAASLLALELDDKQAREHCEERIATATTSPEERRSAIHELLARRELMKQPLAESSVRAVERMCFELREPMIDGRRLRR